MGNEIRSRERSLWLLPAVLTLCAVLVLVLPLAGMFARMDGESIRVVFHQDALGTVIGRSVLASLLTTAIALVLAYLLSWCMVRTNIPGKKVFRVLVILPMLIPSVSIGMGVVLLGGNSGILTNLFGLTTSHVYGLPGILWGSVLYSLPVAFLMIENILKFEDSAPYEMARILGIPRKNQFTAITLPYLRKPMIAVVFSVFTLSFTDYGVPLMVGGKFKTLPVVLYQEVIGQLNFDKGCVYGSILLIPAVLAFLLDLANKNENNGAFVTKPFEIAPNRTRDGAALVCTVGLALFSILPILSFVVLAFVKKYPTDLSLTLENITDTFRMRGGDYLLNSVSIALCVAVIGVVVAVLLAYLTARTNLRGVRILHLVAMATGAIPGVVLGLAYVLFFKGSPIYGTLAILIMANTVHFFSSPYLMMYNAFSKINENLESVAATLGISRVRLLKDILLPRCRDTVGEMFSYFFVNSMMTISAVSFLAAARTKPMALMINQFEAQGQMEAAAVVSLMILLVNIAVKAIAERSKKEG